MTKVTGDSAPRIAIFMQDLRAGGAERMMLNLARGLVAVGARPYLVLVRASGDLMPLVPASVPVVDLQRRRTVQAIRVLAAHLRAARPAAVLASQVHVNVAAVIAGRLSRSGVRIVVSERAQTSAHFNSYRSGLVGLAHRAIPWAYRRADGIIAVSRGVADDLATFARLPRGRITVLNNPVVTPDLLELAAAPVDHPWFERGEPPVILGVGRLHPQKDFGTLLHAFARLRQRCHARLVIVGEGDERRFLESLAAELGVAADVDLPGFTPNPYRFMAHAAVVALSSRWEGSPNVLVEAMACGTPVVATDCPSGPAETLENGRYGALVPMGDPTALADALGRTLDTPLSAEDLVARSRDFEMATASLAYLRVLTVNY